MTGYCSSEEKEFFYRNAKALLFPSFWEGLGFPVIEAMSVGLPVIISRTSSLPEVGGDLAYYLDQPNNSNALCQLMINVSNLSEKNRCKLSEESIARAKKFSREKCALQLMELFREYTE